MKKKQIIGIVLIVGGVTALSYLYNSYYKAYKTIKAYKTEPEYHPLINRILNKKIIFFCNLW